jgi:hypothetical protein
MTTKKPSKKSQIKKSLRPPITHININVRRTLGDEVSEAAQDRELMYMAKIADLFNIESDVAIKVYDKNGDFLYSPTEN